MNNINNKRGRKNGLYTDKSKRWKILRSAWFLILIEETDYLKVQRFLNREDIDLELEPHIIQFLEECFIVRENWDRFAQDMKIVSSKIKDVLFKIECFGEDFGNDIWFAFALNGKYYQDDVEIKYPEFDPTRMFLKDE